MVIQEPGCWPVVVLERSFFAITVFHLPLPHVRLDCCVVRDLNFPTSDPVVLRQIKTGFRLVISYSPSDESADVCVMRLLVRNCGDLHRDCCGPKTG